MNKPCINHKDGNKYNNHYSNLEWCTQSENNKHAYDNKLRIWSTKSKEKVSTTMGINSFNVYKDNILIGTYNSLKQCERELGVNNANISRCLKGKYKQCNGYIFKTIS